MRKKLVFIFVFILSCLTVGVYRLQMSTTPLLGVARFKALTTNQPSHSAPSALISSPLTTESRSLLDNVAVHLTQSSSPEQEDEIRAGARDLSAIEIGELRDLVLAEGAASNDKIAAVYLLIEAEAFPALSEIAVAPVHVEGRPAAHSLAEIKLHEQRSLRISAMDALDEASFEHPENRKAFARMLSSQNDPNLQRLALIALRGYEQNRPGKLHRYIVSATAAQ